MEHQFVLSCESTVDLPYAYVAGRDIPILFYAYTVDGKEYDDDMGRDAQALPRFYALLDGGSQPSTSQLNEFQYERFFEELLQRGDVLHIAFGSGMTGSASNAQRAYYRPGGYAGRSAEHLPHHAPGRWRTHDCL